MFEHRYSTALGSILSLLSLSGLLAQTPGRYGVHPDGTAVTSLTNPNDGTRVLVLFFVASDCPISNRTFPEMKRVREEFQQRGAAFWFVYPNRGEEGVGVLAHQRAFDPQGSALLDTSGEVTRLARARVTPEVSVLVPSPSQSWTPVYTGRIDDRYVRLGLERPSATQRFAERAIAEALRGAPVEPPTGNPVGCGIVRSLQ